MRKRILAILAAISLVTVSLTGCVNGFEQKTGEYVRLLTEQADDEWVPFVSAKAKNNKVYQIQIDAISRVDGVTRKFKQAQDNNDEWAKQIGEIDKYLLTVGKAEGMNVDENGYITGSGAPDVDIDVACYVNALKEMLAANEPTPRGKFKDGVKNYVCETNYKNTDLKLACDITIYSGSIYGINIFFVDADGQKVEDLKGPAKKLADRFDEIEKDLIFTQDATKYADTDKEIDILLNGTMNPETNMLIKGVLLK